LLCAALIALAVAWAGPARRSLRAALAHCFPRAVYGDPSARLDCKLWLANNLLILLVLPALCFSITGVKAGTEARLPTLLGPAPLGGEPSFWGRAAMTAGDILALDAGLFLAHYLQHRVPALWEFHKTHHSAAVLMPITVFRMHPVDLWL